MAVWTHQGFRPSSAKENLSQLRGDQNHFDDLQSEQILLFVRSVIEGQPDCPLPSSFDDFSDGIVLIKLLETLTNQPIARYSKRPRLAIQKIENINIAIAFMEGFFKLKVFGCNPKDIVQGNEKQVVGLLFLLMTRVRQMRLLANDTDGGDQTEEEDDEEEDRKMKRFPTFGWWKKDLMTSPRPREKKEDEKEEGKEEEEEEGKGKGKEEEEEKENQKEAQEKEDKEKEDKEKEDKEKEDKEKEAQEKEAQEKEAQEKEAQEKESKQNELTEKEAKEKEAKEKEQKEKEAKAKETIAKAAKAKEAFRKQERERKEKEQQLKEEAERKEREEKERQEKEKKEQEEKERQRREEEERKEQEQKEEQEKIEREKKKEKEKEEDKSEEKEDTGVKFNSGVKFTDLEDDDDDDDDDEQDEYLVVTKKEEKSGLIRMQSFVSRFNKKQATAVSPVEKDRMEYLYEEFKQPHNLHSLIRLQAVVRKLVVQRAYRMKINRRNQIAQEILNTERSYKVGLDTLINVFQDPLINQKIISADSARAMFGSATIILAMCNRLLGDLEDRLAKWYSEGQRIADIFLGIVKMLKIYTDYVNNYNIALEEIARVRRSNKDFRSFLKTATNRCNGMEINSYLVLPIQRIPRYVMLLEQMYKYTPENHPDHNDLGQVVIDIREVAEYVNDKKRAAESQMQVKKCSDQINGLDFDLVVPSRRYVYEGFLLEKEDRKVRDRYVFLFNDLWLVSSHQKGKHFGTGTKTKEFDLSQEIFSYRESVDFEDMEVKECSFDPDEIDWKKKKCLYKKSELFGFTINRVKKSHFSEYNGVFYSLDMKTQLLWMARIDNSIAEAVDCRLSHLGITPDFSFEVDYTKEGFLEYLGPNGKWLERLVVLDKGVLSIYRVKEGKNKKILKESVPVGCCSVRVVEVSNRQNCFQISSANQLFMFHSNTNSERYEWVIAIRHVLRQIICEREKEIVYQERMKDDPNFIIRDMVKGKNCQDCGKQEIGWVNMTLGTLYCKQCGGIHRTLGYSVKMKAIGFGKWSMEEAENFREMHEEQSSKWADPKEIEKPSPDSPHADKFKYAQLKYASILSDSQGRPASAISSTQAAEGTLRSFTSSGLGKAKRSSKMANSGGGASSRPSSALTSSSPKPDRRKKGIICEGVLEMKKGEEWKKYFVTVKKNKVLQYRDLENRRRVLGEIDLQMVSVSCSFEVDRQYTFKIITLMKQHMFAAPNEGEIEKWVAAIGFGTAAPDGQASGKFSKRFSRLDKRRKDD